MPAALIVIAFKLHYAPSGDLVPGGLWEVVVRLFSLARWEAVAVSIIKRLVAVQEWGLHLVAVLAAAVWLVRRHRTSAVDPEAGAIARGLVIVMFLFLAVYLLSPHDAAWHVRYSFDRLVFQCWPSAVFAMLLAACPRRASAKSQ